MLTVLCPNRTQRTLRVLQACNRTAESCGFIPPVSLRPTSLSPIWTSGTPLGFFSASVTTAQYGQAQARPRRMSPSVARLRPGRETVLTRIRCSRCGLVKPRMRNGPGWCSRCDGDVSVADFLRRTCPVAQLPCRTKTPSQFWRPWGLPFACRTPCREWGQDRCPERP